MHFIYHMIPAKMTGDCVLPLRDLGRLAPERHAHFLERYAESPDYPKTEVPELGCRRDEVVHLSPMHPHLIYQAAREAFPDWDKPRLFYQIPTTELFGKPLVLCAGAQVTRLDLTEYRPFEALPPGTTAAIRAQHKGGEKAYAVLAALPHVMVRGLLHIGFYDILDWRDPIGSEPYERSTAAKEYEP